MSKKEEETGRVAEWRRRGLARCRVCGCTEADACADICSWVEADLCSTCHTAINAVAEWVDNAHQPNWAALRREVDRLFERGKTLKAGGGDARG